MASHYSMALGIRSVGEEVKHKPLVRILGTTGEREA
jgi:hypothetical protein